MLLSFGRLLTSQRLKCMSFNNEPYLVAPTLTNLNPNNYGTIHLDGMKFVFILIINLQ